MNTNQNATQQPAPTACQPAKPTIPAKPHALTNRAKQEEYEKEYRQQLRRLQCPGCGESEIF